MASRSAKPTEASSSELYSFIGAASGYLIAGPLLILLNNRILNDVGFPFPIALSAMGVAFAAGTSRLMFASGLLSYSHLPAVYASHGVSSWRFYFSTALPIGALSALTLALGNASYVHLSVAMCTMLKATTPAMTFVLLFAFRIETPTVYEALCVLVITLGTIVATRGDLALSRLGVAMQLGANAAEALRLVLSQWLLANMKLPLFEMQYHVAPPQLLCLIVSALALEMRSATDRAAALAAVAQHPSYFVVAGVLGLLLQVVGLIAVKVTGSVALKLLGIARGAGLVLFEVLTATGKGGSQPPSPVQLAGYTASVAGFGVYTFARLRGGPQAAPAGASKQKAQ